MNTLHRFTLVAALLVAATGATSCNQTLHRVDFPSSTVWNQMLAGFTSPYNDLSLVTTGFDIQAALVPGFVFTGTTVLGYCTIPPADSAIVACTNGDPANCSADCAAQGGSLVAARYAYTLEVLLGRPTFQSGGLQVVSAAHGVQYSLTLAVNASTNVVNLVGSISDGVLPLANKINNTNTGIFDSYAQIAFLPHDSAFADATFPANAPAPSFACTTSSLGDTVILDTTKSVQASYACGSMVFNVSLGQPLDIKKDVLARLRSLRATVTDKKRGDELDEAIRSLNASVNARLWTDGSHPVACKGARVFENEAAAVEELRELVSEKETTLDKTQLQSFIDDLMRADQMIAQTAISDATAAHVHQRRLTRAMNQLHAGDVAASTGWPVQAIEHYRHAWATLVGDCDDDSDHDSDHDHDR
jgi:hypothetical protein